MKKITKAQILLLHQHLINKFGGSDGLRDESLLDSALAAPFHTFGGEDVFPSVEQKAARLGFGLVKNHPFSDGNKRIGAHSMLTFLIANGVMVTYTQKELYETIIQIASGEASYETLLQWIMEHKI